MTFVHPHGSAALNLGVGPDDGVTDVARREALLKTGALQNAILRSVNFSSIATDEKGVIPLLNVGAERMLGYAAADVVDKITPADISDPRELIARAEALSAELGTTILPGFQALVFRASGGLEDIYELTCLRKDGSRIPAMVSVTALRDAQGEIIGYLLIATDNTARKQIEAERLILNERLRDSLLALQEKNVELGRAKAAAEKANQAKSEFLSSMSHELRSPLNAILGFAQLMETDVPPPSAVARASIDQILRAGWYLLELINEILDLAAIESGRISLSLEPVSLAEVLFECHAMTESQAQRRGLTMTFPNFAAPMFVKVDRTRMKQVLINLPGMSGVEALKVLREDPRTAHIPVVARSANALPRDVQRGLEAGFLRYLTRPIVVGRFMATLTEALAAADEALPGVHDPRASDLGA